MNLTFCFDTKTYLVLSNCKFEVEDIYVPVLKPLDIKTSPLLKAALFSIPNVQCHCIAYL